MNAQQHNARLAINLPVAAERASTIRILGTLGMLASPGLGLVGLLSNPQQPPNFVYATALTLMFAIGWMCSIIGLRLLRATGNGRASAIVFGIQMVGLSLAILQEVQDFIYGSARPDTVFYTICDMAWPVSMLLMLVGGTLVIRAHVLAGWRRFIPLICGLGLPMMMAIGGFLGNDISGLLFVGFTTLLWLTMGYIVRSQPQRG